MPALATRRIDAVVAAVLAAVSVAQVLIFPIAPWPVGIVIALASTAPIAFRHTHPVRALLVGTAPWLIPTDGYLVVGYVAVFLLLYSFAVQIDDLRLVVIAPVVLFGVSVWPLLRDDEPIGEWLGTILAVTVPVAVGRFVRRERERTRQMSVAEERARIARELHDVVAHSISVIAVQADGRRGRARPDPRARGDPLRGDRGARRARRWPRCGGCSACCAATTARARARSPGSPQLGAASAMRDGRAAGDAGGRRRAATAARRASTSPRTGSCRRR